MAGALVCQRIGFRNPCICNAAIRFCSSLTSCGWCVRMEQSSSFPWAGTPARLHLPRLCLTRVGCSCPVGPARLAGFFFGLCVIVATHLTRLVHPKRRFGKMARPEKEPEQKRTNILKIRLTDEERAILDAASETGKTSTWARITLLRVAQRERKAGESNAHE